MNNHHCLFCNSPLHHIFVNLGTCPPSNAFLTLEQCDEPEVFHPLRVYVCDECLLVQCPFFKRPQDIFNHDYVYHSSWSSSWVNHAKDYVDHICKRLGLDEESFVIEVGSNDGYLLQHMIARGVPCLGIDPSTGAASIAQTRGIPTITDFFDTTLARRLANSGKHVDLVCGINVFAHVPNINDFIEGMCILLKPNGVITMEFPHLMRLVQDVQFDTIYHEHYFYYSLKIVEKMLEAHALRLFDVEQLPTHGGSLRVYACRKEANYKKTSQVNKILQLEEDRGMNTLFFYEHFQEKVLDIRHKVMHFLLKIADTHKKIIGYGAAAKGNTMINYFGIREDLLPLIVDSSPVKQGKFLPGSRIPVHAPAEIKKLKPDYLFIFPWNLRDEISMQHAYIREWGGKFVTAIPTLKIW